jgi:hypothetical protein
MTIKINNEQNNSMFWGILQQQKKKKSSLMTALDDLQKENVQQRLSSIIGRLRSGKRLSHAEMAFLRTHAPDAHAQALQIMRQREMMERQMKSAQTKQQVHTISTTMVVSTANTAKSGDPLVTENAAALASQYADAYREYSQTEHYKRKDCMFKIRNRDRFVK